MAKSACTMSKKQQQTCCTWTLVSSKDQKPNHDSEQPLASNRASWPDRQREKTENPFFFHSGSDKTNFDANFGGINWTILVCVSFAVVLLCVIQTNI